MQTTCHMLYRYWNEVRGTRMAPRRFEIEPARIAQILPETFVLERNDPRAYRFRLAGTRICDQLGVELRGRNLSDLIDPQDRAELEPGLKALSEQGAALLLSLEGEAEDGRRAAFECLILPLVHTQNSISRYLGAFTAVNPPLWLGTMAMSPFRVRHRDVIWPDGRPYAVIDRMDRQAPFLPGFAQARIVRSDRRQFRVFEGGRAARDAGER